MQNLHTIWDFAKKVIERAFPGVLKFLSVFDFVSFILHFTIDFPFWVSTGIAVIILLASFFLVWRDALNENAKLAQQVNKFKSQIPRYRIAVDSVSTSFSVLPKLKEAKRLLRTASDEMNDEYFLQGLLGETAQIGFESPEDEVKRLKSHLEELRAYEKRIHNIYMLKLSVLADKNDENVEIDFKISNGSLIIEDDYIRNNVPTTSNPDSALVGYEASSLSRISVPFGDDYVNDDGVAKIFIDKVNSKREYPIPNNTMYIETKARTLRATAVIYSKKLPEPQRLSLKITIPQDDTRITVSDFE